MMAECSPEKLEQTRGLAGPYFRKQLCSCITGTVEAPTMIVHTVHVIGQGHRSLTEQAGSSNPCSACI